ncbi:hypothetical protein BSKO_11704 [Bryopsis sp. KO-2023]|nr:hypothetical protein BSKO_11704 [Bryopsis sp. KO-2023]
MRSARFNLGGASCSTAMEIRSSHRCGQATDGSRLLVVRAQHRNPVAQFGSKRTVLSSYTRRQTTVASAGVFHPGEEMSEHSDQMLPGNLSVPTTSMAGKGLGSSGGAATLSRSKLSLKQEVTNVTPHTDDAGGGGDNGKSISNGGGGEGDGGDDDDYSFGDGEGEGEGDGDGFFRKVMPQLYDKLSISAVLSEWYRTVNDLPRILRRAVEMGLFSSAQLVRFCSMDVRPNVTRMMSRKMSPQLSRALVGRLMADPAFCQKMILEQCLAMGTSLAYEAKMRGDNFSKELDLVAINTVGLMSATTAVVWLLAPSRSFGAAQKLPWQSMLSNLPNNVFDASGPLRNYTNSSRLASFFAKFAELSAVGVISGAATVGVSNLAVKVRKSKNPEFEPSVPIPSVQRSALGFGAFVGLHAHLRYQAIGGIDRYLFDHSNFLWSYLTASALFRTVSTGFGEAARPWFQGLPTEAPQKAVVRRAAHHHHHVHPQTYHAVPQSPSTSTEALQKAPKKKAKGFELSLQN